ncbi:hypothetical protein AYO20_02457 [Fonsecaea nubica]|uniref:Enoyl reductase (ER) domain-containing protein n=1 Tax=Fonsecaea nubica TaxID=856822 RepID=A0A178D8L6_9EURO|nr:hypothetical protein AYO20_02457 [Fonsecaea nubica]OAL38398.1 hypothetical protein AYO20_02457 [Fonsecaea nubica]
MAQGGAQTRKTSKVMSIAPAAGDPGSVYYPLRLDEVTQPTPKGKQVLLKMHAAGINHRDHFIRQNLYPDIAFGVPLFADGCGTVVALGPDAETGWLHKRVVVCPATGWHADPWGPEDKFSILGGTSRNQNGTLQEYMVIEQDALELAPPHLSNVECAALPLTSLTAWRAVMTKCAQHVGPGRKVLVTGIGGGVALMALEFARAVGAEVFVSSGSLEKIEAAKQRGAVGGVSYKHAGWEKELLKLTGGVRLDAVIDGAGGDIVDSAVKILKPGGVLVVYGMTLGPKISFPMSAVLRNMEIRGTTVGSRREFEEMMRVVREKHLRPVISKVVKGLELERVEELFHDVKTGAHFGKLVVSFDNKEDPRSRL